jgi:flagellar biosynthesis/type III secretory pathway ATPase
VDEAIVRVLEAEQAARAAVVQYTSDAEEIRAQARIRAHAIAERAAGRVARVHHWIDAAIRLRVDQLNGERSALHGAEPLDPDEPARVARALDRLAAELSGGAE